MNHSVGPSSTQELYGPRVIGALTGCESVEWYRLDGAAALRDMSGQTRDGPRFERLPILAQPARQPPATDRRLVEILLDDQTYRWHAYPGCKPTYGVGARLSGPRHLVVSVLFCFECDLLRAIGREGDGVVVRDVMHNFLPGRPPLVNLVKSVFPLDGVVQSLRGEARTFRRVPAPGQEP